MSQNQQYQSDSLGRVQTFMNANADVVGPLNSSDGRKQLDAAVTQLASHINDKGSATLTLAGQAEQQDTLMTELVTHHMQPIAIFARAKLRGVPNFASLAAATSGKTAPQLVDLAHAMATTAAPYADALTSGGFPSTTLSDLSAAADALQAVLTTKAATRGNRATATKGITQQIGLGREAVRQLHGAMLKQLAGNPALLAGWRVARRVVTKPGPARGSTSSAQPAAAPGTTTSSTTPSAKPSTSPSTAAAASAPTPAAPAPASGASAAPA